MSKYNMNFNFDSDGNVYIYHGTLCFLLNDELASRKARNAHMLETLGNGLGYVSEQNFIKILNEYPLDVKRRAYDLIYEYSCDAFKAYSSLTRFLTKELLPLPYADIENSSNKQSL